MDPNEHDGAFVADISIDQTLKRGGHAKQRRVDKSGQGDHAPDSLGEEAPLLGNGRDSSEGSDGEDVEWFGTAELQGLPWWKRPSVSQRLINFSIDNC
jgi:hypothetical protein